MVQKIRRKISEASLLSDLERYRKEAIKLGASDAKVIKAKDVIIDERAQIKCVYPKCHYFGTNANCPPYAIKPEETRKLLKKYKYGIILTTQASSDLFVGPYRALSRRPEWGAMRKKMYEIVSKIESMAFYDGYYFALGFGGGACKRVFCENLDCQALKPGKPCRFPMKARASMEGVGMDVFGTAVRVGWDIYPCGAGLSPKDVPFGRRVGLILIY
jgi:predicted metal-binding protein